MRSLVHLRHGEREPGGPHLTAAGARWAAEVARRLPPFDRVVTSAKARAVETAAAMGYPAADRLEELSELPGPIDRLLSREPPDSFAAYLALVERVAEARAFARRSAERWRSELGRVPDGGRLLMVSHGGIIELGTVGAAGPAVRAWGRPLAPLEGVELRLTDETWSSASVLRWPP